MKKILIILLIASSVVAASAGYYVESVKTKRGLYAKIVNETQYDLVCYIESHDVYVSAYSESLYYPVGSDNFYWGCE